MFSAALFLRMCLPAYEIDEKCFFKRFDEHSWTSSPIEHSTERTFREIRTNIVSFNEQRVSSEHNVYIVETLKHRSWSTYTPTWEMNLSAKIIRESQGRHLCECFARYLPKKSSRWLFRVTVYVRARVCICCKTAIKHPRLCYDCANNRRINFGKFINWSAVLSRVYVQCSKRCSYANDFVL